jgi:myo-inositol-1(or 4)-monophosphatase
MLMDIEFLKKIGRKIYREIHSTTLQFRRTSLGKGASGDITFAIDKIAEDIIIESFEKEGFNLNIIAEEKGIKINQDSGFTLIIDPIDGSKNAVSGVPFFSTSIAIADGNTLESLKIGYIINLINEDEFYAQRSRGAFFNGQRIKSQNNEKPVIIAFEASNPYMALKNILPLFKIATRVRCYGSTSLDLAYLSMGGISIFVTPTPSRIFDFSAGILIAKESDAVVTDINGKKIDALLVNFDTKTTLLVCGNEKLQKSALEALKKA